MEAHEYEAELGRLRAECVRLRGLIDRDRTGLAHGLGACLAVVKGYFWIASDEWGSYEWDERTEKAIREEVGRAFAEIEKIATAALEESGRRANSAFRDEMRRTVNETALQR